MPTKSSDLKDLTLLGHKSQPSKKLEAFPNHNPDRYYLVTLERMNSPVLSRNGSTRFCHDQSGICSR